MSDEASRVLQFLASMPAGRTTMRRESATELLLATDATMMACGSLYRIKTKNIGAGVVEVSLQRW